MSTKDKHDHEFNQDPMMGLGAALEAALVEAEQHSHAKHGESVPQPRPAPVPAAAAPAPPQADDDNDNDNDDMDLFAGMSGDDGRADDAQVDEQHAEADAAPTGESEAARVLRQAAERVKTVAAGGELEMLRNQVKHLRDRFKGEDGRAVRAERQLEIVTNDLKSTRKRFSTVAEREAELNNRIERQKIELPQKARKDVLTSLLPALDSTELLTRNLLANESLDPDVRGAVELLESSWKSVFNNMQIQAFDAVGQQFDPVVHEAISEVVSTSIPPGVCVQQVGRGYMVEHRLLRSAQVVVSKAADDAVQAGDESE
jgi:molecular chaperone GrpE